MPRCCQKVINKKVDTGATKLIFYGVILTYLINVFCQSETNPY